MGGEVGNSDLMDTLSCRGEHRQDRRERPY